MKYEKDSLSESVMHTCVSVFLCISVHRLTLSPSVSLPLSLDTKLTGHWVAQYEEGQIVRRVHFHSPLIGTFSFVSANLSFLFPLHSLLGSSLFPCSPPSQHFSLTLSPYVYFPVCSLSLSQKQQCDAFSAFSWNSLSQRERHASFTKRSIEALPPQRSTVKHPEAKGILTLGNLSCVGLWLTPKVRFVWLVWLLCAVLWYGSPGLPERDELRRG